MTAESILASSLVSVVVSAIIGPAIFYVLKTREDRKQHRFDAKFGEFKHYLKALEEISRFSGEEFETYMAGPAQQCIATVLTATNDTQRNQALVAMNQEMTEFVSRLTAAFRRASSELHGLRLVCSETLLEMVNEFVRNQELMLHESISLMGNIKLGGPQLVETPEGSNLIHKGEESKKLFERIVDQMRHELGIHEQ